MAETGRTRSHDELPQATRFGRQHSPKRPVASAVTRGMRLSAMAENLILLRYAETDTGLHRMVSVVKQRESAHDSSLRELIITGKGLDIIDAFPGAAGVLGGRGHTAGNVGRFDS